MRQRNTCPKFSFSKLMDGLIRKRDGVDGIVGETEWDDGDQIVKVVGGVGRSEFHLCASWKSRGAITLTMLKIEEDTSVILETKSGGYV